jgi:FkbM family methyltransferase
MPTRNTIGSIKHVAKVAVDRTQRRIEFREQLFRLASKITPVIAVDVAGVRYFLSTADRDLSRAIFVHGYYEQPLMRRAVAAIARLHGGLGLESRLFIDVGANIGTVTLSAICEFRARGGLALEPHPGNFELLRHNLLANDLLHRVAAVQAAASDRAATVALDVFPSHHGSHRVRTQGDVAWDRFGSGNTESVQAHTITLDAAIQDNGISLDDVGLVWIDTEGHEGHVLAGAERLLHTDVPVLIEFWPEALRVADGLDRLAVLVSQNYTHVLDLQSDTLRPASAIHAIASEYDAKPFPWTDLLLLKVKA